MACATDVIYCPPVREEARVIDLFRGTLRGLGFGSLQGPTESMPWHRGVVLQETRPGDERDGGSVENHVEATLAGVGHLSRGSDASKPSESNKN